MSILGSLRGGPTPGAFILPSQLLMTLVVIGGGAQLGGSTSRWEHLLPIRRHLGHSLPSRSGCLLLRHPRSCLVEARGRGYSWISPCPAAPTDTCSCQQVLCNGSQQCVHGLEWRHPRWQVTQVSYPSCRGASCGLGGRDHGCVAHCGRCPQGRCQARSLVRDGRALKPLANSKTVSAVSLVSPSSRSSTPTMSDCGQLAAASGCNLMPEVTSCMREAHWVKLLPGRSTVVDPAKG